MFLTTSPECLSSLTKRAPFLKQVTRTTVGTIAQAWPLVWWYREAAAAGLGGLGAIAFPTFLAAYVYGRARLAGRSHLVLLAGARWAVVFPLFALLALTFARLGHDVWDAQRTVCLGVLIVALARLCRFSRPGTGLSPSEDCEAPATTALLEPLHVTAQGSTCGVCGTPIEGRESYVLCAACGTPHHRECWDYVGECSVFSCGCRVAKPDSGESAA